MLCCVMLLRSKHTVLENIGLASFNRDVE